MMADRLEVRRIADLNRLADQYRFLTRFVDQAAIFVNFTMNHG
jgi:hypothetical protein